MKDVFSFAGDHPLLAFFLALVVAHIISFPFRLINMWIRHRNIVAAGWPPAHLDADGDTHTPQDCAEGAAND
jgi:hypothetical protein